MIDTGEGSSFGLENQQQEDRHGRVHPMPSVLPWVIIYSVFIAAFLSFSMASITYAIFTVIIALIAIVLIVVTVSV